MGWFSNPDKIRNNQIKKLLRKPIKDYLSKISKIEKIIRGIVRDAGYPENIIQIKKFTKPPRKIRKGLFHGHTIANQPFFELSIDISINAMRKGHVYIVPFVDTRLHDYKQPKFWSRVITGLSSLQQTRKTV